MVQYIKANEELPEKQEPNLESDFGADANPISMYKTSIAHSDSKSSSKSTSLASIKPIRIKKNTGGKYSKMTILTSQNKNLNSRASVFSNVNEYNKKSLMDRFHNEFLDSLESFKEEKPLKNTSALYFDQLMHDREQSVRLSEKVRRKNQRKTLIRLRKHKKQDEEKWRKWLENATQSSTASYPNKTMYQNTGTALSTQEMSANSNPNPPKATGSLFNQQGSYLHSSKQTQDLLNSLPSNCNTVESMMKPQSIHAIHSEKQFTDKKFIETKSLRKAQALSSWSNSLWTKIQEKYNETDTPDISDEDEFDSPSHNEGGNVESMLNEWNNEDHLPSQSTWD